MVNSFCSQQKYRHHASPSLCNKQTDPQVGAGDINQAITLPQWHSHPATPPHRHTHTQWQGEKHIPAPTVLTYFRWLFIVVRLDMDLISFMLLRICLFLYFYSSKRGRKGGVRQRLCKWGNKPPLLRHPQQRKVAELQNWWANSANRRFCHEYRKSSIMLLTETWLRQDIPDSLLQLDSFSKTIFQGNLEEGA